MEHEPVATQDDERPDPLAFENLPAEEIIRLTTLCECFEQQLLANQNPRIESFVESAKPNTLTPLLARLLELEFQFAVQSDLIPNRADYLARFPTHPRLVNRVFEGVCPAIEVADTALLEGELSIPNYTLLSELGAGGMGTVYRALHTILKNEAAIKVLRAEGRDPDKLREMFDSETRNLGQLRHPQIVQALYAGATEAQQPYLVMEMVKGMDVSDLVRHCGPLPVADACEIVRQAAVGLQHANECGMIHRDIKPSNLLLGWTYDQQAEIKVADFGLAKLRFGNTWRGREQDDQRIIGTLDYMSPEQFFTPADIDIRTDVFSLGCTLYALLLGQPPFTGKYNSVLEKMSVHRDTPIASCRSQRPDVPEALEEVIAYATAKDRADRFDTPLEFANSLAYFHNGHDLALLLEMAQERTAPLPQPMLIDSTIASDR